ncbi:MAG TPA: CvpA family protein [Anaerolineales bacterium]|nr:CvpA family protein [Anaerolineales bacterium]
MMSILYVFWMYVIVLGVIGMMRGWAKELLVAFSVVIALTLNLLLKSYIPIVRDLPDNSSSLFWIRTLIVLALVFFGYQTVALVPHLASKATRERLQDALFGFILGGLNGYLIVGTILFYLDQAQYPYPDIISPPIGPMANTIATMMIYMPPHVLGVPAIFFALVLCFIFVIVVYI